MGPTASGKTDLAIDLARTLNCELISVDSALVYRGLDVGSAKPSYPHHLIDIRELNEVYSVANFVADANQLVKDIVSRGKTPLLVGGTMMYFKAFLEGLAKMPPADIEARTVIENEAKTEGWPHIHTQLMKVDPVSAAKIHPNHSQRLARALEVYRSSGVSLSQWQSLQEGVEGGNLPQANYRVVQLAICPYDRAVLHARIAHRFELMLRSGVLAEVAGLMGRNDLDRDLPALRAVGYRQLWSHLEGECALEEGVLKAVAATRQLAKRQLTWLRKWDDLNWIYTDELGNVSPKEGSENVSAEQKPLEVALNYIQNDPI
ncbi:MAG: tRNA dimethylallyltransferase [Halioglobus sp.]|jgi:tRNA dimethylallyltransferase